MMPAVDGYNHTNTIEALLDSRLAFHSLSNGGKKWGKLATFLTKYRALMHQVERNVPFQITLEDDVIPRPTWPNLVQNACALLFSRPHVSVLQMSSYAEVMLTSLEGARRLTSGMRATGIRRNDDQTLLDSSVMAGFGFARRSNDVVRYRGTDIKPRPYTLERKTNRGDIAATSRITWAEMALLRLLTFPPARALPWFGNPPGLDRGW